jgi:hypothetical protein
MSDRKMNTSPASLDEAAAMKQTPISDPKVRKLTIFFSTGLHVTARASSTLTGKTLGVTVFDVLTAIHKQMKKKVRLVHLWRCRSPGGVEGGDV